VFLIAAGLTELAAGSAFVAGLATPLATAALVGVMVNTIGSSKADHGRWYINGGWEYDLTLLITASAVTFTGPGDISLDAAVGLGTLEAGDFLLTPPGGIHDAEAEEDTVTLISVPQPIEFLAAGTSTVR